MADRLEEFISDNREGFDIYEPDPFLWDKINTRKSNNVFRIVFVNNALWKVAAVILVLIAFGWFYAGKNQQKINHSIESMVMPEVAKTEAYYEEQYQEKLNEVEKHLTSYPDLRYNLNYDLQQLDSLYADIKGDLKDGISNENIIEAMIQNYQMKIKILEDVLYFVKHQNPKHAPKLTETDESDTYEI